MPLQLPHPHAPTHLYRHLLREASYLPPLCRPYIVQRIKDRFRKERPIGAHVEKAVREARHGLRSLRAANGGDTWRMLKLCWHALGRRGKRKHDLIARYLRKDGAMDTAALQAFASTKGPEPHDAGAMLRKEGQSSTAEFLTFRADDKSTALHTGMISASNTQGEVKQQSVSEHAGLLKDLEAGRPGWTDQWDLPKLLALAQSQLSRSGGRWPSEMSGRPDPEDRRAFLGPETNCWGKSRSPRQTENTLRRHWLRVIKQLAPPLPEGEWHVLRDLTLEQGDKDAWAIPPRRPVATLFRPASDQNGAPRNAAWRWEEFAQRSVRSMERESSRSRKVLSGKSDTDPRGQRRPIGVRAWKPRLLRRAIYGQLWETSPLMTELAPGKWRTTWGNQPKLSSASAIEMQFFRGVNARGEPPQPLGTPAARSTTPGTKSHDAIRQPRQVSS